MSRPDGTFRFDVHVESSQASLRVTAVSSEGGSSFSGSVVTPLLRDSDSIDAGVIALHLGGGCDPSWVPTFGGAPGVDWTATCFATHDDGSGEGPKLYVGGAFTTAGGVQAKGIASWDGSEWTSLGSGMDAVVWALASYDDGTGPALYAAGEFTYVDGEPLNYIGRWTGASWEPLGTQGSVPGGGTDSVIYAMTTYDDGSGRGPRLYVGGWFQTAGETSASHVASWDGTTWEALGSGLNLDVESLTVHDDGLGGGPVLVAAGGFSKAGNLTVNHIARWNGTNWAAFGTGMNDDVWSVASVDLGAGPRLYAGGWFSAAGSASAKHIACWNGSTWSGLGAGTDDIVTAIRGYDDGAGSGPCLVAAGWFTTAGSVAASHVARWNGTAWSPVAEGTNDGIWALATYDDGSSQGPVLYAAGAFVTAGTRKASRVGRWDGSAWSGPTNSTSLDHFVISMVTFDDGYGGGPRLYVGGLFTSAGSEPGTSAIARWDGDRWSSLGGGMSGSDGVDPTKVSEMIVFDDGLGAGPALYASGSFSMAGATQASNIAKWSPPSGTWSPLGGGLNAAAYCMSVFDDGTGPALFAGGRFTLAGGTAVNHIAKWNAATQAWSTVGGGCNDYIRSLAVFQRDSIEELIATGRFTAAGGAPANRIASWNGDSWSPLGSGLDNNGYDLTTFDDGSGEGELLYVGGYFLTAGGLTANHIAAWDGRSWRTLGGGTDHFVLSVVGFDDGVGSGPQLYAGGHFKAAYGVPDTKHIARWDGTSWKPVGSGVGSDTYVDSVNVLLPFHAPTGPGQPSVKELYVGGTTPLLGGGDSYLTRWRGCATLQSADLNGDGVVGGADLALLLAAWGSPNGYDLNGDGVTNSADLAILLGGWTE